MLDQPVITLSLQWLWQAFLCLSARRGDSCNGPNKIQYSEILAYCEIEEIEGQERRDLCYVVHGVDNAWWELTQKKSDGDGDSA